MAGSPVSVLLVDNKGTLPYEQSTAFPDPNLELTTKKKTQRTHASQNHLDLANKLY